MTDTPAIPVARREAEPRRSFAWLLPLAAVALSAFLLAQGLGGRGPVVHVQAVNGHGIRPGDFVRHLGIEVGQVEEVHLASTLDHVSLRLRLSPAAAGLAREGSRFWIVRPHVALDSVSGLETIVGARYVAVLPGLEGGRRQSEFVALEDPPLAEVVEPGGLEVVLEAPARFGLRPGAPIEYREVRVGTVLAVGLASDASSVEARAYIRPQFVSLVRESTRFWESGGFELELGLTTGLQIGLESLQSMLVGAVRFATPPGAARPVNTGHRFALAERAEEEWLGWRPNLPVGSAAIAAGVEPPATVRARLLWREGKVLKRKRERQGWLIRSADGVIGPLDLLSLPGEAVEGEARLELEGREVALHERTPAEDLGGGLGRLALPADTFAAAAAAWSARPSPEPEDLLLVRDGGADVMAVDRARLEALEGGGLRIGGGLSLDEGWHGAVAIARGDGAPVAVVLVERRQARLAPLP